MTIPCPHTLTQIHALIGTLAYDQRKPLNACA